MIESQERLRLTAYAWPAERFLERLRRSDFPVGRKIPELLPLNATDLLCSRLLTKIKEKDTIKSTAQADPLISKRNLSKQAEPPLSLVPSRGAVW